MKRSPYSSYHGRKSLGRRILTAIAIILAVVLVLAVVAWFVLPDYMTYTADGLQFNLPLPGRGQSKQTAQPQPSQGTGEADPGFVIDEPTPTPAPSAGAETVDLSGLERRELPRGLVVAAGEGPREGQGFIFDMTETMLEGNGDLTSDRAAARELYRGLPYAAAWLAPDWSAALADAEFGQDLAQRCLILADCGFDEIILSEAVPADDGAGLAKIYREVKAELDKADWQGRLSLVLDQSLAGSGYSEDLMPAIAQSFERLYFRRSLQAGVKSALEQGGFDSAYANIVTVYATVPNVNFYWAVLPQ